MTVDLVPPDVGVGGDSSLVRESSGGEGGWGVKS